MDIINQDVTKLNPGGLGVWIKQVPLVNKTICDFLGGPTKRDWSMRTREDLIKGIYNYIKDRLEAKARARYGSSTADFESFIIEVCWHPKEIANECILHHFKRKVKSKEKDFIHACFRKIIGSTFFKEWHTNYLKYAMTEKKKKARCVRFQRRSLMKQERLVGEMTTLVIEEMKKH